MLTPLERASESAWMPAWLRHEHLARYAWATEFAVGRKVIDAACGTGYGTQQVAVSAVALVDGFDVSMEAIAEARRLHASAGVCFEVADVTRLPRPDHIYDLFLSFETIEHVPDDIAFLKEAARVLKPGGTFVCSTPNRMVTNPGISAHGKPFNPFHLREYTRSELESVLGRFFSSVTLLGQTFRSPGYVHVLNRIGAFWPMLAVRIHQARKVLGLPWDRPERHQVATIPHRREPEVLVAVCRGK